MSYSAGSALPDSTPRFYGAPSTPRPCRPRTTLTVGQVRVRRSLRPADLLNLTAWPAGMRANRVPGVASPGHAAALRRHRGLPTLGLGHQHPRRSARRPRNPPPAAKTRLRPHQVRESVLARFAQEVALSSSTASRCRVARSAAWVPSRDPDPQACRPSTKCSP